MKSLLFVFTVIGVVAAHSDRESVIRPAEKTLSGDNSYGRQDEYRPAVREKNIRGGGGNEDFQGKTVCGHMDLRNARCYKLSDPDVYEHAMAVVKIRTGGYACTGWLVGGNNHLMTNHHCISSAEEAAAAQFLFMYESTQGDCQQGGVADPDASAAMTIDGAEFIMADDELDFALLKLTNGNPVCSFGYLDIDWQDPEVGDKIYIPQHPAGRDKSIGITDSHTESGLCEIKRVIHNNVDYTCDTERGTSGSPVVNRETHMVVALHKSGRKNCQGNAGTNMAKLYEIIQEEVYDAYAECN